MKELCIMLLCIDSTILSASTDRTHEERIKFPDSNIILYTLESSYRPYRTENRVYILYKDDFAKYAKKLANKTLTVSQTKQMIAESSFSDYLDAPWVYNPHLQQTQDYILAVMSKYRIS